MLIPTDILLDKSYKLWYNVTMKVFKIKQYKWACVDDVDWEDEHGNLVLCLEAAEELFGLNISNDNLEVKISTRRQVIAKGWKRFERVRSEYVRPFGGEATDIYAHASVELNALGIKSGDSFWVKIDPA